MGLMPPAEDSRYLVSLELELEDGTLIWTFPEPLGDLSMDDDVAHTVNQGETLFTLAGKYYSGMPRPCGLWWAIAEYQKIPVADPFSPLEAGTTIKVPSLRTVIEIFLSEDRLDLDSRMMATEYLP